jgi:acyl-ACP thioesterase
LGEFIGKFRVQFGDVDRNNQLTMHGMLRLLQEVSNVHSDLVGYGVNQIGETNYSWVLYQQRMHLYERPHWNTELTIRTWSRGAEGLTCLRDYEATDAAGNIIARGSSSWLLVDATTQRMIKIPEGLMEKYGTVEENVLKEPLTRLKPIGDAPLLWEYRICRRDIDINRHVNNLNYVNFALEALPEDIPETAFNDVTIMFKKASFYGDTVGCFGAWEIPSSDSAPELLETESETAKYPFVAAIKNPEGTLLHAVVRLEWRP